MVHPEYANSDNKQVKLVLVGGCRNAEDATRVEGLRALAKELKIDVSNPHCYITLPLH
jgi:alpha-1,2-mannosyltransferase